jgi:hypothetical protein
MLSMLIADQDRNRAGFIAGLRMLADLLEQVPEVPHYRHQSISFALGGTEAEAFETVDLAAAALTAAGIAFEHNDYGGPCIEFVLAGVQYSFSRLTDAVAATYEAQRSYEKNVQVAA